MKILDNRKEFLYKFEDRQKSAVTNFILKIIREGEKNIECVLSRILGSLYEIYRFLKEVRDKIEGGGNYGR